MEDARTNPGSVIDGRFVLLRALGGGGAATVWQARDLENNSDVALKLIHPKYRRQHGPLLVEKEALALSSLSHPSIARPHVVQLDRVQPYIALEYVEGHTLAEELGTRARTESFFPSRELLAIFKELCDAIDHAHQRGVVHRDLKPPNIMMTPPESGGRLKVLDFGIAKLLAEEAHNQTTEGRVQGSLTYMSPEQSAGTPVDERTDIFALGCLLFELLTLRRAWLVNDDGTQVPAYTGSTPLDRNNNPVAISDRIAHGPRPSVSGVRPSLPPALDGIIERALHADPRMRPRTALELYQEVESAFALVAEEEAPPAQPTITKTLLLPQRTAVLKVKQQDAMRNMRTAAVFTAGLAIGAIVFAFLSRAPSAAAPSVETSPVETSPVETSPAATAMPRVTASAVARPEEKPPAEPVRETKPARPQRAAEPQPPAQQPAPARRADPLARLLAAARSAPDDPARLARLRDAIAAEAERLADPESKQRVLRLLSTSAMMGDLDGVERAMREVERARVE